MAYCKVVALRALRNISHLINFTCASSLYAAYRHVTIFRQLKICIAICKACLFACSKHHSEFALKRKSSTIGDSIPCTVYLSHFYSAIFRMYFSRFSFTQKFSLIYFSRCCIFISAQSCEENNQWFFFIVWAPRIFKYLYDTAMQINVRIKTKTPHRIERLRL